ncbi:MAG: hypothetical protein Ct9H300mP25_09690 [Acidobacteriota bacterium]|nr:MAG: hypothetical protein Ct9H300mP25_09690 [Acidobacteriota bacterium]
MAKGPDNTLGLSLALLPAEVRRRFEIDNTTTGVLVIGPEVLVLVCPAEMSFFELAPNQLRTHRMSLSWLPRREKRASRRLFSMWRGIRIGDL